MDEKKIAKATFDFIRILRNMHGSKDTLQSLLVLKQARDYLADMNLDELIAGLKCDSEK